MDTAAAAEVREMGRVAETEMATPVASVETVAAAMDYLSATAARFAAVVEALDNRTTAIRIPDRTESDGALRAATGIIVVDDLYRNTDDIGATITRLEAITDQIRLD